MAKTKSPEREERIAMEIIVDAHDSEEVAMSWYHYLDDVLVFPFTATCTSERATSPLQKGDYVDVLELADADECGHEILVMIRSDVKRRLAIPLAQLKPGGDTGKATAEAVADWRYWVKQGHEF